MHGQMIGLVALDEILRRFFRGMHRIVLEFPWRGDLLLNGPADTSRFRVPSYMIPDLKL